MQQKINSAPNAALSELDALENSDSQSSCCYTFFCCCCASDDEEGTQLDPLSEEGQESLALLKSHLQALIIPLEQYNLYKKNRSTVEQTISVQRDKTLRILESAIKKSQYPDLSETIITALTRAKSAIAHQKNPSVGAEEEESEDSRYRDDRNLL